MLFVTQNMSWTNPLCMIYGNMNGIYGNMNQILELILTFLCMLQEFYNKVLLKIN